MPVRRGSESLQLESHLPVRPLVLSILSFLKQLIQKVRLISQPDFGHELRQAQAIIANLSGRVTQGEIAERTARSTIDSFRERVESLEGELSELQVVSSLMTSTNSLS